MIRAASNTFVLVAKLFFLIDLESLFSELHMSDMRLKDWIWNRTDDKLDLMSIIVSSATNVMHTFASKPRKREERKLAEFFS